MDHDVELNLLHLKDDGSLRPSSTHSRSGRTKKPVAVSAHGQDNNRGYYDDEPERNRASRPSFGQGGLHNLDDLDDGLGGMGGVRRKNPFLRWADSFRRDPNLRFTTDLLYNNRDGSFYTGSVSGPAGATAATAAAAAQSSQHYHDDGSSGGSGSGGGGHFDMHGANFATAHSGLARKLQGRHLQMIAMGGSIGTGLFVASGRMLSLGGPAAVLLAYSIIGAMLYGTMHALGELAIAFPVAGSFSAFSTRFLDPSWGFAMGWNYAMQWMIVMPVEVVAASMTVGYWNPHLSRDLFVTIFLLVIVVINLFGIKGYGEAEFVFALVKVVAIVGFILLGIVINIGGTPTEGYIGSKFWYNPGAFHNGFKGLCSVLVTAAFAFAGTELVGLAAAEAHNPRKTLPTAIKQVFWRISLFYIVALTLVGLLVPYDNPRLPSAKNAADATASPFVIAIESAGIQVLPSVMNSVILVAVVSVGNSCIFGSSRTLAALADQGQAPRFLSYIDRRGRPLLAILVASAFGLLAYLASDKHEADILGWMLALSGLSSIFTWSSICLSHIRFRRALARRGRSVNELAFRAQGGVAGSYIGLTLNALVMAAQFWVGLFPIGYELNSWSKNVEILFLQYLAVPIVAVFWLGHKVWRRTSYVRLDDMDLDTGRRENNRALQRIELYECVDRGNIPRWKKIYKFFC